MEKSDDNNSRIRENRLSSFVSDFTQKFFKYKLNLILLLCFALLGSSYQKSVSSFKEKNVEENLTPFIEHIKSAFEENKNKRTISSIKLIKNFYHGRMYHPYWTINFKTKQHTSEFISLIKKSRYYGFNPGLFDLNKIEQFENLLKKETEYNKLVELRKDYEILLTQKAFDFLVHLNKGILYADTVDYTNENNWFLSSLPNFLEAADNNGSFKQNILKIQPSCLEYKRLLAGMNNFLNKVNISDQKVLIPDVESDSAECYKVARHILTELGYIVEKTNHEDNDFTKSLMAFQQHHGYKADGKLSKRTLKALSKNTYERYRKIALNLERIRWEEQDNRHYALVNIPAYKLRIIENEQERLTLNTVIGKPSTPTPELTGNIEKVITFPNWNVPRSIKREILYRIKRDSNYLSRNNYKVYNQNNELIDLSNLEQLDHHSLRFVQTSSRYNALGIVKFIFPNMHSVYLHDTPSKNLFKKDFRAYSHGCVRLQHPDRFASYLLKTDQKNEETIKKLKRNLSSGIQQTFRLNNPFPIYLRYYTCEADDKGNIFFYDDIYGLDDELEKKLFKEKSSV